MICPLIESGCIGADCEMWGRVSTRVDPTWLKQRAQEIAERESKSAWWRFWHPESYGPFGPLPREIPVHGCKLKGGVVSTSDTGDNS